jgi:glycosyltransferase involved in cell wall biosynthesis
VSARLNASEKLSILIPIYNEEQILERAVRDLVRELDATGYAYEIILCENGSRDRTREIGGALAGDLAGVQLLSYPEPNYGKALATGMKAATGAYLICFEIDFWDVGFISQALLRLDENDIVVGSKRATGSRDQRPFVRRLATKVFNLMLRVLLGFKGTDTHGLKALRRESVIDIVDACETDRDVFVTELIVRAQYLGLPIAEIPIQVHEIRPAPINIYRRVPKAVKQVLRLWKLSRGWKRQSIAARATMAQRRRAAA